MKNGRNVMWIAIVSVAMAAGNAQGITTLDFNGQATGLFSTITEQGFNFNWVGVGDMQEVRSLGGGNNALFDSNFILGNNSGAEVTVSRAGGGLFDLISFDLLNLGNVVQNSVIVAGTTYFPAVGSTTITPNLVGITSFNISLVSATAAPSLGGGVSDYGIDNIVVQVPAPPPPTNNNAVPEPITATLGLMGLGVLGMATRRRVV